MVNRNGRSREENYRLNAKHRSASSCKESIVLRRNLCGEYTVKRLNHGFFSDLIS